jgi:hypothetical protein
MKTTIKFTACESLDFDQSKYSANLSKIASGNQTKLVWERKDPDGDLQLCQFCKKRGRVNYTEGCLNSNSAMCHDYADYEHIIELITN